MPDRKRCPGIDVTHDSHQTVPTHRPDGLTMAIALRCPICGGMFARWYLWRGDFLHDLPDDARRQAYETA